MRRLAIGFVIALVIYSLFGFFGVPLVIRHIIVPSISKRVDGEIHLESATSNPFTWRITLTNARVVDGAGVEVAGFEHLDANIQVLRTVFTSGTHLKQCIITRPRCHVAIDPDGRLNLADVFLPREHPDEPMREIPRYVIDDLQIIRALITFRDDTTAEPVETEIDDMSFAISNLDTAPDHENAHRLTAHLSGGASVEWTGSFFADPLTSTGTLRITHAKIDPFLPYIHRFTETRLAGGTITLDLGYDFAPLASPSVAAVEEMSITLADVEIAFEGEPLVDLPRLELAGVAIDAEAQSIKVQNMAITDATLHARREGLKEWQLMRALRFDETALPVINEADAGDLERSPDVRDRLLAAIQGIIRDAESAWSIHIAQVTLVNGSAIASDPNIPSGPLTFEKFAITAGPLHSANEFASPFTLEASLGESRRVRLEGDAAPVRGDISATIETVAFPIDPGAHFLPFELRRLWPDLNVLHGDFTTTGRLACTGLGTTDLVVTWNGGAELSAMEVSGFTESSPSLTTDRIALDGSIEVDANDGVGALIWSGEISIEEGSLTSTFAGPNTIAAGLAHLDGELRLALPVVGEPVLHYQGELDAAGASIEAKEMYALRGSVESVRIEALGLHLPENRIVGRSLTLLSPQVSMEVIFPDPSHQTDTAAETPAAAERPLIELPLNAAVETVTIENAAISVVDPHRGQPLAFNLREASLTASQIDTQDAGSSEIAFSAVVENSGRIDFAGRFALFAAHTTADGEFNLKSIPIVPYDSLVSLYIGHHVDEGRADLRVPFRLDDRQVAGEIDFVFNRLFLGESVDSPAAPNVPVKFGLSLLRDSNDQIAGNVPFEGDLDDPGFSYAGLVWRAILNLIIKAATAPFQLIGAMFGEGEEDLGNIAFEPGTSDFAEGEVGKLDTIARAMNERPELTLVIEGRAAPEVDGAGLWKDALRGAVFEFARRLVPDIEELNDATYRMVVRHLYYEERVEERLALSRDPSTPEVPFESMEKTVAETLTLPDAPEGSYRALVDQRASKVADFLRQEAGITPDRVIVEPVAPGHLTDTEPRAALTIR